MAHDRDQPITVINIISVAFSGSTWVNLLLGSHSRAFSVGEMKRLLREPQPTCTIHGRECRLWLKFQFDPDANPFVQLAELTGRDVFIVNNSRKFMRYQTGSPVRAKYVHLVRDGRPVVASMIRKGKYASVRAAARDLVHEVKRNERLMRRQPAEDAMHVRYEDVLADTPGNVRRLCEWAGLTFEPQMLEFWQHEHHFLGGNPGTLFSMLRQGGGDADAQGRRTDTSLEWNLDHYREASTDRFRDERWKHELSDRQLRMFALIAGRMNRRFGYPPALQRDT